MTERTRVIDRARVTDLWELPPGPVVKICGLTRPGDVTLARDLGTWALGFVFAPSPRRLTPAAARGLVEALADRPRARPVLVGVFGGMSVGEIAEVVREVGLDAAQLHDPAGPDATALREALGPAAGQVRIIQAVPVGPGAPDDEALGEAVAKARATADLVLLDTSTGGKFGGTGVKFSWRSAAVVGAGGPLLIAGGITPENVQAALGESAAWGVDVSSGVETVPGQKDLHRLEGLFAAVAAATAAQGRT
jgi:phosphoribosylanthranilate isomerase